MAYHLTLKSDNGKTGPIPVSTSSARTCPVSCEARAVCYAASGPLSLHWRAVTAGERGTDWRGFLRAVRQLPSGQLWRHNQAGDLPGRGDHLELRQLRDLVEANRGKRGFTYTHKPLTNSVARAIAAANRRGFVVNLSADSLSQADEFADRADAPIVVLLPSIQTSNTRTPAGRRVVVCPAVTKPGVTCATCKLCAWAERKVIIGFPAHGAKRNALGEVS